MAPSARHKNDNLFSDGDKEEWIPSGALARREMFPNKSVEQTTPSGIYF
jgi:hypothetical protein